MEQKREQMMDTPVVLSRSFIVIGAILAGLAVMIGAFGAHALSEQLVGRGREIWETAVQYQFIHSIALIIIGILLLLLTTPKLLRLAGFLFLIGTMLFSGSLYLIALLSVKNLGLVTPIGGLFFIVGWILLICAALLSTRIRA